MYLLFMFILWFLIYLLKEKLKELKRSIGDRREVLGIVLMNKKFR